MPIAGRPTSADEGLHGVSGEGTQVPNAFMFVLAGSAALAAGAYGRTHPENKAPVVVVALLVMALGWYLATQGI